LSFFITEGDSESDVMLQCSIPSGSGNITVQVLPLKPNVELEGQFLVRFDDKNVKSPYGDSLNIYHLLTTII
jgi:hypothetical protein